MKQNIGSSKYQSLYIDFDYANNLHEYKLFFVLDRAGSYMIDLYSDDLLINLSVVTGTKFKTL